MCINFFAVLLTLFSLGFSLNAEAFELSRRLTDDALWTRFPLNRDHINRRPTRIHETPDGAPFLVLDSGAAWYDGFQWRLVEAFEGPDLRRFDKDLVAAAPDGRFLVSAGRSVGTVHHGVFRELHSRPRIAEWVFGMAPLDGLGLAIVVQLGEGEPLHQLVLLDETGNLRPLDPPAPLIASSQHHLRYSRANRAYLNTVEGLFVWSNGGWVRLLAAESAPIDLCHLVENAAGEGLLSIVNPPELRGLWAWEIDRSPWRVSRLAEGRIRSLDISPDGEQVVVYDSGDVLIRDRAQWRWLKDASGPLQRAEQIRFRPNGDLWLIANGQLFLNRKRSPVWTQIRYPGPDPRNRIHEILERRDGTVWLASNGGLEELTDSGELRSLEFPLTGPGAAVTGLAEDTLGNVWASSGSAFDGAFRWSNGEWKHFVEPEGLPELRFHRIVPDRRGRLWFLALRREAFQVAGEPDGGAYMLREDESFQRWGVAEGLSRSLVYAFTEDPLGRFWFATSEGISRWDGEQWIHWSEQDGLVHKRIFDIAASADGTVFFTDRGASLGFIRSDNRVAYLGGDEAAPIKRIWRILAQPDGWVWLAGEEGLGLYKAGTLLNVPGLEIFERNFLWPLARKGDLLLAGTQGTGLIILDTAALQKQGEPRIVIDPPPVSEGTTFISWRIFSAWNEPSPEDIEARVRAGESPWSKWSTRRAVHWSDLKPGRHTVTVQAKSIRGGPVEQSVLLVVPGPWYFEPRFYGPLATLALLLTIVWYTQRLRGREKDLRLQRGEERFRHLFENAGDLMFTRDLQGRITSWNRAAVELTGYLDEEAMGLMFSDLLTPDSLREIEAITADRDVPRTCEVQIVHKDGSVIPVEIRTQLVTDGQGRVLGTQGIGRDLRSRKKSEEILLNVAMGIAGEKGERLFQSLAEQLARQLDVDFAIIAELAHTAADSVTTVAVWASDRILPNFQYALAGTPCANVVRQSLCSYTSGVSRKFPEDSMLSEMQVESYVGAPLFNSAGAPLGLIAVLSKKPMADSHMARSIVQIFGARAGVELEKLRAEKALQRKEAELIQAQKMEAIGRLAGGIAHDFNNLLTVVNGYSQLLLLDLPANSPARSSLEQIDLAGQSAAQLTKQLLGFSRRSVVGQELVDVNKSLMAMEPLLRRLMRENVGFEIDTSAGVGAIRIGLGYFEQIMLNLVVNSTDAMPECGEIVVRTRLEPVAEPSGSGQAGNRRQVVLEVIDNGSGMDEETKARIFEPFFTTKQPEIGTGLGLSTVYGIVSQSSGRIHVDSEPGRGTTVTIRWPREAGRVESGQAPADPAPAGPQSGRVLLVEDHAMVRRFAHGVLERQGYRVLSAARAEAALELATRHGGAIDLLITDVVLPDMSGVVLAANIRQASPSTRVILMSGYTKEIDSLRETDRLLQKPFSSTELSILVRAALRDPASGEFPEPGGGGAPLTVQ